MEYSTILQFTEWYYPAEGSLRNHLKSDAEGLIKIRIDTIFRPPAHK
jgi:alpha-amylase